MNRVQRIPKACFEITVMRDEDFSELVNSEGGWEAWGIWTALIIVAKERFQERRAEPIEGTPSLRFKDSLKHIAGLCQTTRERLVANIEILQAVTQRTGSGSWVYLDDSGHLIIRTFFRHNGGHGGFRKGAGRKPKIEPKTEIKKSSQNQVVNQEGFKCAPPISIPRPIPSPKTVLNGLENVGGGDLKGGCREENKTTTPDPPNSIIPGPPEYQALVERASAIWTSTTAPFPRELREAWGRNGALAAWWEEIPDRRHWRIALDELATDEKGPPTLRRFLRFVQNVSRRPPPATNGRPHGEPPKPRREKRTPEEIKAFLAEVAAFQFGPRERRT